MSRGAWIAGSSRRSCAEHKIGEDEAFELAPELAYGLAKRAYKL